MATYHNNKKIKWSDSGIAYHDNGRIACSSGIAYHDNGRIAFSSGIAYHDNGRIAYSSGIAYHDNGRIALSSGIFYDSNGRIIKNKSFSIGLGRGITLEIIPNIKITVYGRKIN